MNPFENYLNEHRKRDSCEYDLSKRTIALARRLAHVKKWMDDTE